MHILPSLPLIVYIVLLCLFPVWTIAGTFAFILLISLWDLHVSQQGSRKRLVNSAAKVTVWFFMIVVIIPSLVIYDDLTLHS